MAQLLRIAIAQINTVVGDLEGNTQKILQNIQKAKELETDIISFPELSMTGYPPEDLLLKQKFVKDNLKMLETLAKSVHRIVAIVGFVDREGVDIYNTAAIIDNGRIMAKYHKMLLPNYGVFDEERYFKAGSSPFVFRLDSIIFGVNICEDIWHKHGPAKLQASLGASLIVNINASPYHAGKIKVREEIITKQSRENNIFVVYTNLVGGQDELVFDGQSMIADNHGKIIFRAKAFEEDLLLADLNLPSQKKKPKIVLSSGILKEKKPILSQGENRELGDMEEIYQALILGLRDYVKKNGFKEVVIGLSGGIDSSLVAAIAFDALGKENVVGTFMPSSYTSKESKEDAQKLARNLGIEFITVPIQEVFNIYLKILKETFEGKKQDITEENLQARIRGNILMALSNKFGWLVLNTGNKSEVSAGYSTLYGDMVGGFGVIKDVPKTLVYKLAEFRNKIEGEEIIPSRVLKKEPSAELKPNQRDRDTLPPYEVLDPILKLYIEEDKNFSEIIKTNLDRNMIARVIKMIDRNEYKRRQSAPGIKITPKAFGRDRRMPITNRYRG